MISLSDTAIVPLKAASEVLGRGRPNLPRGLSPRARVLMRWHAVAGSWATRDTYAADSKKGPTKAQLTPAIAIVWLLFLCLCSCSDSQLRAAEAADSPTFFDWGIRMTTSGMPASINSIHVLGTRGGSRRATTLDYMTGGQSEIVDENAVALARDQRAPDRMMVEHRVGEVVVRHWGPDGPGTAAAEAFTRRAAKAIYLVTTQVWPRQTIPLQVDIYEMPDGATYSLARKVQWKRGLPLQLVIFKTASDPDSHRDVATHELYHVLAAAFRTGQWTPDARKRPNASSGFEEIAASLFATCGAVLADGKIARPLGSSYLVNGTPMNPPLSGEQVRQILAWIRSADTRNAYVKNGLSVGTTLGGILDSMPVFHLFESGQERIELQSPQGNQLLDTCREFTSDPAKIEPWLESLR